MKSHPPFLDDEAPDDEESGWDPLSVSLALVILALIVLLFTTYFSTRRSGVETQQETITTDQ